MKTTITNCVKVKRKEAEKAKKQLQAKGLLDHSFSPKAVGDFIYFPVIVKKITGFDIVKQGVQRRREKPSSLEEALKKMGIEPSGITKSFDIIGDIAVIEVPKGMEKYEKKIAKAVMEVHPNLKTVAKRTGPVSGVYRIRKVKVIAGKKKTETTHTETGCKFHLDVNKVYFSPRLVYERQRIAKQTKKRETVFIPFAGVGPFAIITAKTQPDCIVYANELNPDAFNYLEENIRINKTPNVKAIPGDIRKITPKYKGIADRIIMPHPTAAESFLDIAFLLAKKGCIIHIYLFVSDMEEAIKKIREISKELKKKIKILDSRVSREYAPSIIEAVIDFQILS